MSSPDPTRPDAVHPLDVVSLTAGLLAVLAAGLYLLADLTSADAGPALVVAVLAVVLGAGGLLAAVRRLHRS